jgi:hypothetical protein
MQHADMAQGHTVGMQRTRRRHPHPMRLGTPSLAPLPASRKAISLLTLLMFMGPLLRDNNAVYKPPNPGRVRVAKGYEKCGGQRRRGKGRHSGRTAVGNYFATWLFSEAKRYLRQGVLTSLHVCCHQVHLANLLPSFVPLPSLFTLFRCLPSCSCVFL